MRYSHGTIFSGLELTSKSQDEENPEEAGVWVDYNSEVLHHHVCQGLNVTRRQYKASKAAS